MNKDVVKAIPDCIEKIGRFTPAKHREFRKSMMYALPFSILGGTIYCIHKERMIDKQYEHEETMLQICLLYTSPSPTRPY